MDFSASAVLQRIRNSLQNPANRNAVIPVNTGMGSNQLEVQITTYNNILLARNNLAASSSANNPLVRDYDTQLVGMREAIDRAIVEEPPVSVREGRHDPSGLSCGDR